MTRHDVMDAAELAARLAWYATDIGIRCHTQAAERAVALCALERAWRRHTERCCSGEDGGYVRRRATLRALLPTEWEHDPEAEARAEARIRAKVATWCAEVPGAVVELEGDPRGCVMRIRLPGMTRSVPV